MLKYTLILSLLSFSLSASAQVIDPGLEAPANTTGFPDTTAPQIFRMVEQMPSFPGDTLNRYLAANMRYPKKAEEESIQGKTFIKMVIREDGSLQNIEIARSSGNELLDAEALRVVRAMPKWIPGKQNGKPVSVYYTLPIIFRLL